MATLLYHANVEVFSWQGTFEERLLPKEAGFRWHPEKKVWWTSDVSKAARLAKYAEPAALAAIQAHEAVKAASRAATTTFCAPCPDGLALYPFQNAGVEYMLRAYDAGKPGGLLADEMGLGKTPQCLALVNVLRERLGRQPRVLYVAPKSLLANVRNEARKWLLGSPNIQVWTTKVGSTDAHLVVINYDILKKRLADLVARGEWDLVILDESQAVKNQKAQRTKAALAIPAKFRVFATGTPIMNRPIELFTTLSAIDAGALGSNYVRFGIRYAGAYQDKWGWHFDGATNLEELQEKLRSGLMVRRLKADVLTELPAKVRSVVPLEVDRETGRLLKAQREAWDRVVAEIGYEEAVRRMETTGGVGFEEMAAMRAELAAKKVEPTLEYLKDQLESVESVVIFAHHHVLLDALVDGLAEYGVVSIDGRTSQEARQRAVEDFQAGKARVFVGGISAAGVGLTLTRASNVYLAELPWTPSAVQQAEDRCIAEGQLVLTPGGWRPIESINPGDLVIGSSGLPRQVLDTWNRGSTRTMAEISIEGWPTPVVCTSDHELLLADGRWVPAQSLRPGDMVAFPEETTQASDLLFLEFPDQLRVPEKFNGAGGLQTNGRRVAAPERISLTDELLFVAGYFVGDGFSSLDPAKGAFVSFSGNPGTKKEALERCVGWLRSQGVNVTTTQRGNSVEARGYSEEWARWFYGAFGHTAAAKRLPEWVFQLSGRQMAVFHSGMMASDGYAAREEYTTASKSLAGQLCLLLRLLGGKPTYRYAETAKSHVVRASTSMHGTPGALVQQVTLRHPKRVNGVRERVYDLTVETDHAFVVGLSVVHNCHRIGQRDVVMVQHLVFDGSLDADMAQTIIHKQATADSALDTDHDAAKRERMDAVEAAVAESLRKLEERHDMAAVLADKREDIHHALRILAGMCDGARERDEMGFNGLDTQFGKQLAAQETLSVGQALAAYKMLAKYRRQLPAELYARLYRAKAAA